MASNNYFFLKSFKACPHRADLVVLPQSNVKYTGQPELGDMLTEPGKVFEMTSKAAFRIENIPHETEFVALEFGAVGINMTPSTIITAENEKHIVLQADYFAHDTPGVKESTNYCVVNSGWVYIPVSRTESGISPMRFVHKFEEPLILKNIQFVGTKPLGLNNSENILHFGSRLFEKTSNLWKEIHGKKGDNADLPCDCAVLLANYNKDDPSESKIIKCHSFIVASRSKRIAKMLDIVIKGKEGESQHNDKNNDNKNEEKEKSKTEETTEKDEIITIAVNDVHPDLFELVLAHCYGVDILSSVSDHIKKMKEDECSDKKIDRLIKMILPLLALAYYFEIPSLVKRIEDEVLTQFDVYDLEKELSDESLDTNDNYALTSISSYLTSLASKISNKIYSCSRKERNAKAASGGIIGSSSQSDNIYGYMLILKYFDSVMGSSGKDDVGTIIGNSDEEDSLRVQCENFWKVNSVHKYVPKWEISAIAQKGQQPINLTHVLGSDVVRKSNGMWELSETELNPTIILPQYLLETTKGGRNMKILTKLHE